MSPILVMTRPTDQSHAFADQVVAHLGQTIPTIVSPALKISFLAQRVEKEPDQLAFTSVNGVRAAEQMGITGLPAWCVGARTAEAAANAGFHPKSAEGDVTKLLAMIQAASPAGEILHVRGEHSVGDLCRLLVKAGLQAKEVVAYRQILQSPTAELAIAFKGTNPLVFPLFSSRSALILGQGEHAAPTHVVAISRNVADAVLGFGVDTCRIAETPNQKAMLVTTCHRLRGLLDGADWLEGRSETR